jgi:hypothetical protein
MGDAGWGTRDEGARMGKQGHLPIVHHGRQNTHKPAPLLRRIPEDLDDLRNICACLPDAPYRNRHRFMQQYLRQRELMSAQAQRNVSTTTQAIHLEEEISRALSSAATRKTQECIYSGPRAGTPEPCP